MQVLAICALLVAGAAGSATVWPGALPLAAVSPAASQRLVSPVAPVALETPAVKTVQPVTTKSFGYTTTQYFNSYPYSYNQISPLRPGLNVAYQYPSYPVFPSYPSYVPVNAFVPQTTFVRPPNSFIFPGIEGQIPQGSPAAPGYPIFPAPPSVPISPSPPNFPSAPSPQPAGDADSDVVESADQTPSQPNQPSAPTPLPEKPSTFGDQFPTQDTSSGQPPEVANTFPSFPQQDPNFPSFPQQGGLFPSFPQVPQQEGNFPSFPQIPQQDGNFPTFPQIPQQDGNFPSFPQIPQQDGNFPSFPQVPFPEGSLPNFPQIPGLPQFPQFPQSPASPETPEAPSTTPAPSIPTTDDGDRGLNDEDTVSIESA